MCVYVCRKGVRVRVSGWVFAAQVSDPIRERSRSTESSKNPLRLRGLDLTPEQQRQRDTKTYRLTLGFKARDGEEGTPVSL